MMKKIVNTAEAPAAIGPYSQAITFGQLVATSGQIPLDPRTGELVPGGIEAQTERVLLNLEALLKAAGSSLRQVVKTTVYLVDLGEFPQMNSVYQRFFNDSFPARTTIQAAALPKGARIEIEALALLETDR